MPEGPEIKRAAEKVARAVAGRVATRIEFAFERLQPYESELESRVVETIDARGKALVTRFQGSPLRIYSHNQLYGRWVTCKPNAIPKSTRSLRLAIHTEHRLALLYSASDITILHSDEEEVSHPYLSKLGPDLLNPNVTADDVALRLDMRRFARRRLGGLYLDQGFLCGPGNYLRSEILFVAGIHPDRRPCDLTSDERDRLSEASITVTRRAYHRRGVTVADDEVAQLKAAGQKRRPARHYVFARERRTCRECGSAIQKLMISGRRLYLCDQCQPLP